MPDHAHMSASMPPKSAVPQVVGSSKGRGATALARVRSERRGALVGRHHRARGFPISTADQGDASVCKDNRAPAHDDQGGEWQCRG